MAKTEQEKMLASELYNAADPVLVVARLCTRELCQTLNALSPRAPDTERSALLTELFGAPSNVYITPPFFCDYGSNIELGESVYFNFNCVILDGAKVTIGDEAVIGAGSVVVKDIPAGVVAAGNPCRVIRKI